MSERDVREMFHVSSGRKECRGRRIPAWTVSPSPQRRTMFSHLDDLPRELFYTAIRSLLISFDTDLKSIGSRRERSLDKKPTQIFTRGGKRRATVARTDTDRAYHGGWMQMRTRASVAGARAAGGTHMAASRNSEESRNPEAS